MSAVFFHNDEQKQLALETKQHEAASRNGDIFTQILPATTFYLAEDYHQKYWLRQERDLLKEFNKIYPNPQDFIDSTAVARVNGYLAGNGTSEMLQTELHKLGLSPAATKKLVDRVSRFDP
jgi:peptide-methionine (S)-S-oxide reductase